MTASQPFTSRESLPGLQRAHRWELAAAPLRCKESLIAMSGGPPCSLKRARFSTAAHKWLIINASYLHKKMRYFASTHRYRGSISV